LSSRAPYFILYSTIHRPPLSTLFPYTTLFRSSLQSHPNLFDVLLNDLYVWETLENEHKTLAIEILARLFAQAAAHHLNPEENHEDRKSTRLNSSHGSISYAVFCYKKKKQKQRT